MMHDITFTAGSASPERKAEITAKAREVSAAAARFHDLLPLCVDGDQALDKAHQELAVAQNQLSMLMVMSGMDALIASMEAPAKDGHEHRPFWRRVLSPIMPRQPRQGDEAQQQEPGAAG